MGEDWGSGERRHHICTYKKALPRHTVSHLSHIHMFFSSFFSKTNNPRHDEPAGFHVCATGGFLVSRVKKTNSKQQKTKYENGALILGGMIGSITAPFAAPLGVSRCRGVQPYVTCKPTFITNVPKGSQSNTT